jgi:cobalt-zinc-cadmium efflux system protein
MVDSLPVAWIDLRRPPSRGAVKTSHDHSRHHLPAQRAAQKRTLRLALGVNACFLVVEVVGGLAFGSLALLADAGHMLTDVFGLGLALGAHGLMGRPSSAQHTFGLQRTEVLGALANGLILVGVVVWIGIEAIQRLTAPPDVAGGGLLAIATFGLALNLVSAWLLRRDRGHSLNMQGAYVHMLSDAIGSLAAVVAGVSVLVWDANWVDPAASLVIAVIIVWATWGLLRDAINVLLEGTPRGMDHAAVERALSEQPGVESIHHLHLWNLASDVRALSVHVVLEGPLDLHEAQNRGDRLKEMLNVRFSVEHTTLELECHNCEMAHIPDEATWSD